MNTTCVRVLMKTWQRKDLKMLKLYLEYIVKKEYIVTKANINAATGS